MSLGNGWEIKKAITSKIKGLKKTKPPDLRLEPPTEPEATGRSWWVFSPQSSYHYPNFLTFSAKSADDSCFSKIYSK